MRHTKIVATIGPVTDSEKQLAALMKGGINVARLNFSHGSHESHGTTIARIAKVRKKLGLPVAIMLDTKGPQIRTGDVHDPIKIRRGEEVFFTSSPTGKEKCKVIEVNYDEFPKDAKRAKKILIDNGVMEFAIVEIKKNGVVAKAKGSGTIGTRRHINLPGAHISLPSYTRKDWNDIAFGIKNGVDFIAPSFVRSGKDIKELRNYLTKAKSPAHIVAKIETAQAVENLDEIIDLSDAIMIARGDLGSEIPFELVPGLQDEMVVKCRRKGKPVIVATHMLESMVEHPMPTRAELTDIAHAAATQADATMLSGETAAGKYPLLSVDAMRKVLTKTEETHVYATDGFLALDSDDNGEPRTEQARAACVLAENIGAKALVVITRHGFTARAVSMFRPEDPILAFTESSVVQRQLSLTWGVIPLLTHLSRNPDQTVDTALNIAKKHKYVKSGDQVVVVSDILATNRAKANGKHHAMSVQIRSVR